MMAFMNVKKRCEYSIGGTGLILCCTTDAHKSADDARGRYNTRYH